MKRPLAIANKPFVDPTSSSAAVKGVEVEDEDEDDEDEDDQVDVDEAAAQLKEQYDSANKLATKYVKGGTPAAHKKAIEKLTEALALAPKIPGASKDISTLYNNRSAMFEKTGAFDKSLADITVVLAMDKFHQKARVRRARINEAKGMLKEALADYAFVTLMQQHKGQMPEFAHKMEELVKTMAKRDTPSSLEGLRSGAGAGAGAARPLPSKAHCRNFFEAYPTFYAWKEYYQSAALDKLKRNVEDLTSCESAVAARVTTAARLEVVCWYLVNNMFVEAFAELEAVPLPDADGKSNEEIPPLAEHVGPVTLLAPYLESTIAAPERMASLVCELKAAELHLKCTIREAAAIYRQALAHCPGNIDARLKLTNLLAENGQSAEAMAVHEDLSKYCSTQQQQGQQQQQEQEKQGPAASDSDGAAAESKGDDGDAGAVGTEAMADASAEEDKVPSSLVRAWTLLHRAAIHVTRDENGKYADGAATLAMDDLDTVLEITEGVQVPLAMKAARLNALIRSVYVLVQSKPLLGEQTTEEDLARNASSIAEAKALFPGNDALLLMEAELISQEGKWDEAEALIKEAQAQPSAMPGDCTPLFVTASLLASKAMMLMMSQMASVEECKKMFEQADEYYKQALMTEPSAIEVLSQYAQYKSTMGQYSDAVEMLRDALQLARTRDDVMDLMQLLYANEAHDSAHREFMGSA